MFKRFISFRSLVPPKAIEENVPYGWNYLFYSSQSKLDRGSITGILKDKNLNGKGPLIEYTEARNKDNLDSAVPYSNTKFIGIGKYSDHY